MNMKPENVQRMRADQLLARFGYCSRREALWWIKGGRVTHRGAAVQDGSVKVDPSEALVDGRPVDFPLGILVAFHKPAGVVCSHQEGEGQRIYDLLPPQWMERHPAPVTVGRLDKDTSGLILITDDGALAHRWSSPRHEIEKEYEAECESDLPADLAAVFASGQLLLRGESSPCRPARLHQTGPRTARLTVTEGRYHLVRRMFASQGSHVARLRRIRIGRLELADLAEGEWRAVRTEDVG
jgi:16S rRNA pseudouridine516 synthase